MARQRGTKWQGDALWEGTRKRVTFNTEAEALKFEADPASFFRPKLTVEQCFLQGYELLWRKTKNQKDAYHNVKDLIALIGGAKPLSVIDEAKVDELIIHWRGKALSDKRINRKLTCLRKLLKWAMGRKHITEVPAIKGFKEYAADIRYLTEQEEQSLRAAIILDKHRRFFDFLLYTGCRYSEARRLKWTNVHQELTAVDLNGTKGNTNRTVPLTNKARLAIAHNDRTKDVWHDIEYNSWHEAFQGAKRRIGLGDDDNVRPHSLRHTCASRLVQRGVDILTVKDWLGHADISTTLIYAKQNRKALFDAAGVLDGGGESPVGGRPSPLLGHNGGPKLVTDFVPTVPDGDKVQDEARSAKVLDILGFS